MTKALPRLADLQAAMIQALHGMEPAKALSKNIRAAAGATAKDALSIYRQSMQSTLANALRLTYPAIARLVGKEFFDAAATSFAQTTPSQHGDLDRYGAAFGEHLARLPYAAELPWLPDLARLEWLLHEIQRRADGPTLTRAGLSGMDITAIADRPLPLASRATLFESRWPVARIWLAQRDDADNPDFEGVDATADRALICGMDTIQVMPLDDASWGLLEALSRHSTLLAAVEKAAAIDPAFDFHSIFAWALDRGAFALPQGP